MNPPGDPSRLVRTALRARHLVVLQCRCGPTRGEARDASREASAWLGRMVGLPRGRVSRSATPGMGVAAAHLDFPVGVDTEALDSAAALADIRAHLLHPAEYTFVAGDLSAHMLTSVWARKEAVLKAFGVGLAVAPASIFTGAYSEDWYRVSHRVLGEAFVRSLRVASGLALAVATLGAAVPVECVDFAP